jgi:hypothetical protein
MNGDLSERRLIENELIFRELNQKVVDGLAELKELAIAHDQASLAPNTTEQLHFYCECSNIDCHERVLISPAEYEKIHEDTRRFVIAKGHQIPEIEKILNSTPEYDIVEKNREPSQVLSE